jgi:hypothetical protein
VSFGGKHNHKLASADFIACSHGMQTVLPEL